MLALLQELRYKSVQADESSFIRSHLHDDGEWNPAGDCPADAHQADSDDSLAMMRVVQHDIML